MVWSIAAKPMHDAMAALEPILVRIFNRDGITVFYCISISIGPWQKPPPKPNQVPTPLLQAAADAAPAPA